MPNPSLDKFPNWLQNLIACIIIVSVLIAGWLTGKDEPIPHWIDAYLVPGLGWIVVLLIAIALGSWLRSRFLQKK